MNLLKNTKDYYIIKKSDLFDIDWFKNTYNLPTNINPIKQYLNHGIKEGLNPSPDFDTIWYLNEHKDVKKSGMDPFIHYIKHGIKEHRLTKPLITKNKNKFSLINYDYNPCFFKDNKSSIDSNIVNIAIFIKNNVENLLPTEYIRLAIPFYHLYLKKNFTPFIFQNNDVANFNFKKFDIIIVQRDALDETNAKNLVDICKQHNIKLIYEIDDDLINIDKTHPNYVEFIEKKESIKYLVSNADVVTVSSNNLKEKLLKYNSEIKVIKNSLNDMLNLENEAKNNSNMVKIGYMGTLTHKNDVKIVEKPLENVKTYFEKKGKKVVFEIVGVSEDKINCANSINVPFKYSKYPYFIRWLKKIIDWDIAIAPLEHNNINESKSEIKYLEYTSLGIAGIYSNFGAYKETIRNDETGLLIKNNTAEEWESALINLIENEDLRKDMVKNALNDIKYNYSIDSTTQLWDELLENLLTKDKKEIFNKPSLKLLLNPLFNKDYNIVSESRLINASEYPINCSNPIYHFLKTGVFEGLNPSKDFNTQKYIEKHEIDVNKTNPLVHFIEKFVNKFKYNQLNQRNIEDIHQNLKKTVTIIIPIYNAYEDVKKCIESVLKHSTKNFELLLINDASSDQRIDALLNTYKNYSNIKIINNQSNFGFVTSVNIGLKNSENDVIILNSDTIVTPKWIEKLTIAAYSDGKIATATPFSNNAGVFSVPKMNEKNNIPQHLGLNGMANIVEKSSNHTYMRVPTGNGFCMYIKRDAINSIGYFDDITFERGYGEENDFCMRAKANGWENIIDDATFIFHNENSSFGDEKNKLIKKHMKLLLKKHPTYENEVSKFINSKKLNEMQQNISYSLLNKNITKKRILQISKSKKIDVNENYENYLFCITEPLTLYYVVDGYLFKINEWSSKKVEEISFNIIINLEIDEIICDGKSEKINKKQ